MTINQYLQSAVIGITLSDSQVEFVIANVDGLTSGADFASVSVRLRDLALAEVLWMVARSVGGGSYSKKVNNRQISESLGQLSKDQRSQMTQEANELRRKHGLPAFRDDEHLIYDASYHWQ